MPPTEALEEIQVIRGAASAIRYTIWRFSELQDKIADQKTFEFTSRNTIGSYGLFTNFTSVSGTNKNSVTTVLQLQTRKWF
jgi:Fe(3+) dicitrate transport protein